MKLAYIISMKIGGVSPFIYREISALKKKGHQIEIFPTKYSSGFFDPKEPIKVHNYNKAAVMIKQPFYLLKNPKQYLSLFFSSIKSKTIINFLLAQYFSNDIKKFDRIHCHFGDNKLFIGYYLKKITGLPLSVTIHAGELYINNFPMFKKALDYCDNIITIADYNKKALVEKFGVAENKIKVIRLFVEKDLFKPNNNFKILVVAFFSERKGHDTLFKALKNMKHKDSEIWVVGSGDVDVEGIAKKIGVEDKVKFFGSQSSPSLRALFNNCDVFCLPSRTERDGVKEGIPVALMEAMAFEKPVVSTKHAGIPELVEDFLIDQNDHKELTKILDKLAKDPKLRNSSGKKNRKIILKKYSDKNLERLEDTFK